MKLWSGRFGKDTDALVDALNASIPFDQRLYKEDIQGSQAHAAMLAKQGIITDEDNEAIQKGLAQILLDIEKGEMEFKLDQEDIHMNIESRLTEQIGQAGKRLHTGRSRNDQVALDFRLFVRRHIPTIISPVSYTHLGCHCGWNYHARSGNDGHLETTFFRYGGLFYFTYPGRC